MPLPGRVVAAPPGVHGFDANSVLNHRICEVAKARGFEFCIRYVSRQDVQPVGDLSDAEANVILDAGLALMVVQHVAPENWSPSQALGTRNGKNAAKHARQIGFPDGVNVWLDLEGARTSTPHETIIAYCNAWFAEVEGCGIRSRSIRRSQGHSDRERTVLAFDDQTLLEVRKQGSRHSASRLSAHSVDHPKRQDRRCCHRSQSHQERQLRRLRAVAGVPTAIRNA